MVRVSVAQQPSAPPEIPSLDSIAAAPVDQRVEGQVVRPGARDMLPVPNIMVTLHRVGSDRAGPLDSMRADAQGRFAFSYQRSGDSSAVYFVSAIYGGIAYFTPPLKDSIVKGEDAEIAVYDTSSAAIPIGVQSSRQAPKRRL